MMKREEAEAIARRLVEPVVLSETDRQYLQDVIAYALRDTWTDGERSGIDLANMNWRETLKNMR